MCIIASKPSGVKLLSDDILNNCWVSNKDGAGFAYNKAGDTWVNIEKGFMTLKALKEGLKKAGVSKEHNIIYHFRFATHGLCDEGNCHPFPLTSNYDDMRLTRARCKTAIAHNGVFGSMPASAKYSDTMKFIGGVLASPEVVNNLHKQSVKELIRGYCGGSSKLAFLQPKGITLVGVWNKHKGVSYSNEGYKSYTTRYASGGYGWASTGKGNGISNHTPALLESYETTYRDDLARYDDDNDVCDYCGQDGAYWSGQWAGNLCDKCAVVFDKGGK